MATSRFQFSLFLLPIFAWAGAFALNSSGNCLSDQLRLQTEHEGSFRIRDYRNSATDRVELSCSTGRCMLDTGGGRSLMTLDDFKKLQSPSRRLPDPVTLPTLQGPIQFHEYVLDHFTIEGERFENFHVLVSKDFPATSSPLIGRNAIQAARVEMKFKQKKFFWRKNPTQRKTAALTPINSWYCLPIKVSKNTLQAGFDTGAPTTLIDRKFFNDHRSLFRNVREQGGVAFAQLARPLTIQGQKFQDVDVVISDLKGSLGNNTPDAFLGLNVIRQKNWIVDFKNLTFSVY